MLPAGFDFLEDRVELCFAIGGPIFFLRATISTISMHFVKLSVIMGYRI